MKYISLLRGINVGGQKKVKMADLKSLYEGIGFESVTSYIQSGNVLFDSECDQRHEIQSRIENAIKERYQFDVHADIRTGKELEIIINMCPYEEANSEGNGTKVLVTFLQSVPSSTVVAEAMKYVKPPEKLTVHDRNVYLYCPDGYGRSRLSNAFLESKLGVKATTRNWKSVKKLYELSKQ